MATKTLILKPGECAVLPKDATITTVIVDGDGQPRNTCGALPTPSTYACWAFDWEQSESGAVRDAYFISLTVGDNVYQVPSGYNAYNNSGFPIPVPLLLAQWIDGNPDFQGLVKLGCSNLTGGGSYFLKIKIPSGLPAPIFKLGNPNADSLKYFYLYAIPDPDCDAC